MRLAGDNLHMEDGILAQVDAVVGAEGEVTQTEALLTEARRRTQNFRNQLISVEDFTTPFCSDHCV